MSDHLLPDDWFPCPLPANCKLGEGSWLYSSFAFLHCCSRVLEAVRVGKDTGLYPGTFFDLGPAAEVHIGDFCSVVGAIFSTRGRILIGDYVFISHEVLVADDEACIPPGADTPAELPTRRGADTIIEDDVWIGAQAIILGGVRIGAGAIIGAATLVDRDVPPYTIFAGNPGRVVGSVLRGDKGECL